MGGSCIYGLQTLLTIVYVLKVGANVSYNDHSIGTFHYEIVTVSMQRAALSEYSYQATEAHSALSVFVETRIAHNVEFALAR